MNDAVTTGKLIEDLQLVVRDAEALLQATAAQGGEKIEAVRARASESLQSAKRRLAVAEKQLREEARQAAAAADDYVHANPWQAVGAAAGIGLLLGLLIGRR
jgi:ElaB/YqjD/DUF883 family membrane-anchored ribosome-binding protein